MIDLTVLIITKDEEKNLEKCLQSVNSVAKRIVVVDSGSTDKTVEIAQKNGADVFFHEFTNHASQLNWGLENTGIDTKWIMRMDADEELTDELQNEIRTKLPVLDDSVSGIFLKRRVYFMGKWIKHGGVYPLHVLRIFKNGSAVCEQRIMDEHFVVTDGGKEITFKYDFCDKNEKPLDWWLNKHNWYSNLEMKAYIKEQESDSNDGVKPKLFGTAVERKRWLKNVMYYKTPILRRAHWYFIYRYFLKLGFLDGKEGLIFHFLQGYWYRFVVDAKIYEEIKNKK